MAIDRFTGSFKGFAFILFEESNDAHKCIDEMRDYEVDGRRIKLELSLNKPKPTDRDRPRSNVCYEWLKNGHCSRGQCRFDHFEERGGGGGYRDNSRGGGGGYRDNRGSAGRRDRSRSRDRSRYDDHDRSRYDDRDRDRHDDRRERDRGSRY